MSFAAVNYSATLDQAFANDSSLRKRVYDAIKSTPQHAPLFEDIAKYTLNNVRSDNANASRTVVVANEEPAPKKRKLQNGDAEASSEPLAGLTEDAPLKFYIQDVSFSVPMRKKLTLEMTAGGYLRARNQTSKQVEFGFHVSKIRHVVAVPVPEKNQRQFNFCVIPWYGDVVNPPPDGEAAPEAMVWTVADGPPKAAFSGAGQQLGAEGETGENLLRRMLNESLTHTQVVRPDDKQFVSAMVEAHRKTDKAYHVKAFRGSKEGYLFFLSTGIFFGFKKPLVFFAFEDIESISYTSVLQRTFNLNIATRSASNPEAEPQEFELSMIDQADFSGIDTYIKKHGLQDASLAEARRAKKYNVNAPKNEEAAVANGAGEEEEESELQKAQRELEDQEDEEEEDYDPGSEGDSDGSGSSSEEDDDEEGEGDEENGEEDGEGGDLMDELGSEAEDPEDQV
ncbi:hypothetical protein DTO164E3_5999 [Paecilomyces variotii]|nr:hypothetical protein DTO164E3_5999 [Paecilomyces variotii]KAJ9197795.1 hypothetical protein DTO032I3_5752 [Paecilomyces variotii]KAJ9277592.1 hypothetical protein DTO021D3_5426 [Paecilomyces variotii]KAJ9341852.1 hypothetical protein DTO027B6_5502 [Paecilomyces variotii]KAJ9389239.1 hypothetical protein DTO032I4_2264 [Paecilomyces variotii]